MLTRQNDDLLIDDIKDEIREAAEYRSANSRADEGLDSGFAATPASALSSSSRN
jgi:hypothetical protein